MNGHSSFLIRFSTGLFQTRRGGGPEYFRVRGGLDL
jgi:hypothetical protein